MPRSACCASSQCSANSDRVYTDACIYFSRQCYQCATSPGLLVDPPKLNAEQPHVSSQQHSHAVPFQATYLSERQRGQPYEYHMHNSAPNTTANTATIGNRGSQLLSDIYRAYSLSSFSPMLSVKNSMRLWSARVVSHAVRKPSPQLYR